MTSAANEKLVIENTQRDRSRRHASGMLKGGKHWKIALGGYVISTLPKLKEMLEGLQVDLRANFGPLSALSQLSFSWS